MKVQIFLCSSTESQVGTGPMRGRPKRVRAGEVAYLVVRLDVEIDLLACECADSGEHGMLARCFAVVFVLGSCDDALGTGLC